MNVNGAASAAFVALFNQTNDGGSGDSTVDEYYELRARQLGVRDRAASAMSGMGDVLEVVAPMPGGKLKFFGRVGKVFRFGRGFKSHDEMVAALGPAGKDRDWHHVVEQHNFNVARFGPEKNTQYWKRHCD
jgi:hypothetical protein